MIDVIIPAYRGLAQTRRCLESVLAAPVRALLLTIPFGEVRSYAWIARKMGNAKAMRAVGHANGRNRWPLVVPCHRVVGSDGFLTGFSALGGLDLKAKLLRHEGVPLAGRGVQGFRDSRGRGEP